MSNEFIRCDDEFEIVEEDTDMSSFAQNRIDAKQSYTLPDVSRELKIPNTYCANREMEKRQNAHTLDAGIQYLTNAFERFIREICDMEE